MTVTVPRSRPPEAGPAGHASDRELARRMLAGEATALDEFAERYVSAVYRFALSRLPDDRETALEAAQAAMARAIDRLSTYRGEAALLTWLCACCRNEILMLLRRRRAHPDEVGLDDGVRPAAELPATDGDPESGLLRRERGRLVHAVLDSLPAHWASALEWKYLERLSVKEIAVRLATSPKAVESLLGRARLAFRAAHDELESTAGTDDGTPGDEGTTSWTNAKR